MKKKFIFMICLSVCFLITACTSNQKHENTKKGAIIQEKSSKVENKKKNMEKKIILTINDSQYDVTLYDTPAANALYDMLPLDLVFEDFNNIEKIAYLKQALPTENEPDGFDPNVGDLCLYAPWGNLSIFYKDFIYSDSLVSLGYINTGIDDI